MFSSIRVRLTLSHLAVIVVATALSGFVLLSLVESYFLQAMANNLAAQAGITAQTLIPGAMAAPAGAAPASAFNTVQQQNSNLSLQAQNVAPAPAAGTTLGDVNLSYLADASLQLSAQLDTRIRILDAGGLVLVDSQGQEQSLDLKADPLVAQALAGRVASRAERRGAEPAMYLAQPVLVDGKLAGVVYLSQPLRDALAVIRDLRTRWLLASAAALLLSAVVGLALARAITRPLLELTAAAGAVAEGKLNQQVPAAGRDELGGLSRAFNAMTRRLGAARQMQVDFVANVSHELRTPLTTIKGMVETLRDGAVDDPEVRDRFLETVDGETDRLIRLVNGLLLLSRADSEALELHPAAVDVGELARTIAGRLAPQAEAKGLTLRVEAPPGLPPALADADRVAQVLVNLLDNAIKYSRPGGGVTVQVDAGPGGPLQVRVRDQGAGIAAQDLARIGERFYRADRARSRAEGGSGLGLAIAQALVEAHGGRLWLESEEGRGTVATFTLPRADL